MASAGQEVGEHGDRGDHHGSTKRAEHDRLGNVRGHRNGGGGTPLPFDRLGVLTLDGLGPERDDCAGRGAGDVEERVGIRGRQELERLRSQLRADEHELRRDWVGNRDAHEVRFGVPGVRP
jgi:hypothetical protein